MTTIATKNFDIYADETGNLAMADGIIAVLQQCEQVMLLQLGEAIYDTERGMPYEDSVFDRLRLDRFEAYARRNLLSVPGVTEIKRFRVSPNGDELTYEAVIMTEYGEGSFRG